MDETPTSPPQPPQLEEMSPGSLFLRGFALIGGGVLLGFFGCLGGLSIGSGGLALAMLTVGAIGLFWGIGLLFTAIGRAIFR